MLNYRLRLHVHLGNAKVALFLLVVGYTAVRLGGELSVPFYVATVVGFVALSVWHERFKPADAAEFPKDVVVGPGATALGMLRFVEGSRVPATHTNKFGHDYLPPAPSSPAYP